VSSIRVHDKENASIQLDVLKFVRDFRYGDTYLSILTVILLKVMLNIHINLQCTLMYPYQPSISVVLTTW